MKKINFPKYTGIRCSMMPVYQGRGESLPPEYEGYREILDKLALPGEAGLIGLLTIHESWVEAGQSQRGYNSTGALRSVHREAGQDPLGFHWGGGGDLGWGRSHVARLREDTQVLIANSVADTCRIWPVEDRRWSLDGDLTQYLEDYPEETGQLLGAGEVVQIGIFTPHEPLIQPVSGPRQFIRLVGQGVTGREPYFTENPLIREVV